MKKNTLIFSLFLCVNLFAQIENGMTAHFPFNNSLNDVSGENIQLTNLGCTYGLDRNGTVNFGLDLSNQSYLSFNDPSIKTALPISISVWVNISSFSESNIIFTSDNEYNNYHGFWMNVVPGTGQVGISMAGGLGGQNANNRRSFVTNSGLTQGQWQHIVAIINDFDDMEIYFDCVSQAGAYSGTGSTVISYSNYDSRIGSNIGNNFNTEGSFFEGSMDQLVIWNRALNSSEISYMCDFNNELSVDDNIQLHTINCYPNPSNVGVFTMELNYADRYKIQITDLKGRQILNTELNNKSTFDLDLSNYSNQIFILNISDANGNANRIKLVKN